MFITQYLCSRAVAYTPCNDHWRANGQWVWYEIECFPFLGNDLVVKELTAISFYSMLKQAERNWLCLANWECRSRSPLRLANRLKEDRILSAGCSEAFHRKSLCNFLTARPAFYSWLGITAIWISNTRCKQTKINGDLNWFHILKLNCSVKTKKTNVQQIHNEVMNIRKSYIHWFRPEIHRLKGIDRREDKEWLSFTTWFTVWIQIEIVNFDYTCLAKMK